MGRTRVLVMSLGLTLLFTAAAPGFCAALCSFVTCQPAAESTCCKDKAVQPECPKCEQQAEIASAKGPAVSWVAAWTMPDMPAVLPTPPALSPVEVEPDWRPIVAPRANAPPRPPDRVHAPRGPPYDVA